MDVDLSTDLCAVLPLVAPLISNHSDVAIGTRLSRSSRVTRGAKREFISRSYNLILRGSLSASFSDAQCGFKAIRTDVAHQLLRLIEDDKLAATPDQGLELAVLVIANAATTLIRFLTLSRLMAPR